MHTRNTAVALCVLLALATPAFTQEQTTPSKQSSRSFSKIVSKEIQLDYLLYLPKDYDESATNKWPFILFLHGAGERGSDLHQLLVNGIPKEAEREAGLPFVAVSPQCPEDDWWSNPLLVEALNALVDQMIADHNIDTNRIYLTGLSMGGYGTWSLAAEYPEKFAAIAPVCGRGNPSRAYRLRTIPAWVFHGAKDDIVEPVHSEEMVAALKEWDADVTFTLYPDANHNSWDVTYSNPELYTWFLSHTKSENELLSPAPQVVTATSGDFSLALDQDMHTRWESEWTNNQSATLTFGAPVTLRKMRIAWENAFGRSYSISISDDGETWNQIFHEDNGNGGADTILFDPPITATYMKFDFHERGTQWGFSIWEIDFFPAGKTKSAE